MSFTLPVPAFVGVGVDSFEEEMNSLRRRRAKEQDCPPPP